MFDIASTFVSPATHAPVSRTTHERFPSGYWMSVVSFIVIRIVALVAFTKVVLRRLVIVPLMMLALTRTLIKIRVEFPGVRLLMFHVVFSIVGDGVLL